MHILASQKAKKKYDIKVSLFSFVKFISVSMELHGGGHNMLLSYINLFFCDYYLKIIGSIWAFKFEILGHPTLVWS